MTTDEQRAAHLWRANAVVSGEHTDFDGAAKDLAHAVLSLDAALATAEQDRDAALLAIRGIAAEARKLAADLGETEYLLAIEQEKSRAVARECGRLAEALAVFADPENWIHAHNEWVGDGEPEPWDFARRELEGKP